MKNMNKILAVSILAITAVSSANAKIVSESLLTSTPGTYTSTNTVQAAIADAKKAGTDAAALASGKVSSVGTGSANGTISVNGSDVAVKGLKSAAYTESSAYATAAQGALADTALQSHQDISGKQDKNNMVTATTGTDFTSNKTSTTKYPSMATANALAESVQNNLGSQIAGKQDILLSGATGANVVVDGDGDVITAVDAPGNGTITFTKDTKLGALATKDAVTSALITDGTITTSDISSTAGITKGQLASAVQTSLGKADTALQSHQDISGKLNIAQGSSAASKAVITDGSGNITTGTITGGMITDGTITTSDISSTAGITKAQLASAVQTSLGKADTALQSHQDISGKLNIAQGSTAASKAVITDGSGNITTGTITSGMITDGTITTSDISSTAGITKGQLASAVQTSLGKADTALQSSDIAGKQNNLGGTAGQLVATTATAGTVAYTPSVPSSIPSTPVKDGMFVLTAKVVNSTPTFYWEDIGR